MRLVKVLPAILALAAMPLSAPAAVSGIVGTTVDCFGGQAIPYAHVVIRASGSRQNTRDLVSDHSGHFTALGLTPGLYYVAVEGTRSDSSYWGPHNLRLETNDIQRVRVGASAVADRQCRPFAIPHGQLLHDQTTLD